VIPRFLGIVAYTAGALWAAAVPAVCAGGADGPPTRVVVVVSSTDAVLADLEHMVVTLGGDQKGWDNNVYPNIDIFLFGVDKGRAVRFDQLFDAASGQRTLFIIPLAEDDGLETFIKENLDPIGIIAKPVKRTDKTWYKVTSDPEDLYTGWMRVAHKYAFMSPVEADVPATIAAPADSHQELLQPGYDLAAQLDNAGTTLEQRRAAFAKFRENTLAGIKKRLNETPEAFALREKNSQQQLETFERLFVESAKFTIGWTTDTEKSEGRGHLELSAVEGTPLETMLKVQVVEPAYFQNIKSAENAVLSGRWNFTLDELLKGHFRELYELSHPVNHQKIDAQEGITDEQKAARKEINDYLFAMLDAVLEIGRWDGAVEITPHESGTHTVLLGVRAADGAKALPILELLPKSKPGWTVETGVGTEGDVAIHKLTMAEGYPQALKDFFGPTGEFYVGTGPQAVWFSGGEGALEALQAGVKSVAEPAAESDRIVARLDLHMLPALQVLKGLRDEGVLDVMKLLQSSAPEEEPSADGKSAKPGSDTARMLKDFQWREAAIEALSGSDDRLHMHLERVDDHLEGTTTTATGLLKMLGILLAKFAKENLG
jgi:hypothetical protein